MAANDSEMRQRILGAALQAFAEHGYAGTSTLHIATRAKVSKRDLYAHFASKQAALVDCIKARSEQMQLPAQLSVPRTRKALATTLATFATQVLVETSHPTVMAMFRLAIAEAAHAPEVAQALDERRKANRRTLSALFAGCQSAGLMPDGDTAEMASRYLSLVWGDLMLGLLLGVAARPSRAQIERRVTEATTAFLQLYPQ
jgi:AcrR family transcriptional regulator